MQYRQAPNSTRRQSPPEIMFNRLICTRLDLMKHNITTEMNEKSKHHVKLRECKVGDKVQIRLYSNPRVKWKFGTGLAHYDVTLDGKNHNPYEGRDIEHGQNKYQVSDEPEQESNLLYPTVQHDTIASRRRTNDPLFSNSHSTTNVNDQPFLSTSAINSESTSWYSTASPFVDSTLKIEPHHPATLLWRSRSWRTSQQSPTIFEQQPEQTTEDEYSPGMQNHPGDICRSSRIRRPRMRLDP
jgi:hypothetical protein